MTVEANPIPHDLCVWEVFVAMDGVMQAMMAGGTSAAVLRLVSRDLGQQR